MSLQATTRNGNGNSPVTRFLKLQRAAFTRRNYTTTLKQFFRFLDGEPIRRLPSERTSNGDDVLEILDAKAVEYLAAVRAGERSAGDDLMDFVVQMEREGYSPSSVLGARAGVSGFFEVSGVELSRLEEKVIKRRLPKYKVVSEEETITLEILRSIMPHMHTHDRAVTLVLLSSGARIGETLKLRVRDIDLGAVPARVTFRAATTKTKVRRTSFLTPEAVEALRAWLKVRSQYIATSAARTNGLVTMGRAVPKDPNDERLFPFEPTTFYRGWNRAVQKAGLYEKCEETGRVTIHAHGLRKFFRTYFGAAAGVDVAEKLMGHDGYLTGAYVRLAEDDLARAYEENCHVLTVASGASGELKRRIADMEAENANLRDRVALMESRRAELNTFEESPEFLAAVARAVANLSTDK